MFLTAWISIAVCLAALLVTLIIQHNTRATLGLPLAYMISLLLIHLPGAYAYAVSGGAYSGLQNSSDAIADGIMLTAIATVCFVVGMAIANQGRSSDHAMQTGTGNGSRNALASLDPGFSTYCLVAGWVMAFGAGALSSIPSLSVAIYFGSSVWMLAVMIGLTNALQSRNVLAAVCWILLILAFPLTILVTSGFMSFGAAAVIVVGSLPVIRMRSPMQSMLVIAVLGYLGMSVFVNYFSIRTELRSVVWSGAALEQRVEVTSRVFSDFTLLELSNPKHMRALTLRLNQNEFVGIAHQRLESGQAEYLRGESVKDALISMIPRAIWSDKPKMGGSGDVVRDMTGMYLGRDTSWGVGNVMEFYINFGLWSLIPGFLALGFVIAWIDRRAALALRSRDYSKSLYYFLPGVALIQPNGSLTELIGGALAALFAAFALRTGWRMLSPGQHSQPGHPTQAMRRGLR